MSKFTPVVKVFREPWDEETIMVTRRMSQHTNQSMVWAMSHEELVNLKAEIDSYLESNDPQ